MTSVLIVDDSPLIRCFLRTALTDTGWIMCEEAENGQDGILKAQRVHPDFIILDLAMPVMNGLDAARVLTRIMPSTPLLLFTMQTASDLNNDAMAAGIRKIVSKSEGAPVLIDAIRALLPLPAGRNAA